MTTELSKAWELFAAGDAQGAMRTLRLAADELSSAEIAPLVAKLAQGAGFADLAEASAALAAKPQEADRLYQFGYACVERGVPALAVPALREALRSSLAPQRTGLFGRKTKSTVDPRGVLLELVTSLERGERHTEALALLLEHDSLLTDWPDRYLVVYNALMSGQVEVAQRTFDALSAPEGVWVQPGERVGRMLARAAAVPPVDDQDLRGWHHALTGGLLTTLSPHGFTQGMTGRWAFLQDDFGACLRGLERLRLVLDATGRKPASVALLPDRGSRALGLAAAQLLGLPAAPYEPGTPDTLVVAYDLNECDPELLGGLHTRASGEVLYEHASCWTDAPAVTADVCTLLVQTVIAPWEPGLQIGADGKPVEQEPDERSAEELAEAILAADPTPDQGDGNTPPDPDKALAAFAARAAAGWLTGPRERVRSSGPVRSSRFS
ncbi:hypothetical protein [Kitasatospora azatica]|uniref:hypothetical protein n=1 Tax=Kitasatospora azatica TaxID=58347 RepID=UPI0006911CF6|nr:hypothetical protein [Kitasatospora azatica]